MPLLQRFTIATLMGGLLSCSDANRGEAKIDQLSSENCSVELVVLGVGQDAAAPQIGYHNDVAWDDIKEKRLATSLAVIDFENDHRYLFEATPNIAEQLKLLDRIAPNNKPSLGLSGIFITHAHIGHYAGLMFLGREAAGTQNVPVYAMPRLYGFFRDNGPWEQLVTLGNISLSKMSDQTSVNLSNNVVVTPYQVPHRDEYSETVGYKINTKDKAVLFIPDIDNWDEWERDFNIKIEDMIRDVDFAFLDSTFYSDDELPGRDMSKIPHPRVSTMMDRFDELGESDKRKIHFIHVNHTNPIRFKTSKESEMVKSRGYNIARRGDRHCLSQK